MKLAHLSDPHFAAVSYDPKQFLSKQWIGNLNLILFRSKLHESSVLYSFPRILNELEVDHVCITGDFVTTGWNKEFALARAWLDTLSQPVVWVPGNHDVYTYQAEKEQRVYRSFPSTTRSFGYSLHHDRLEAFPFNDSWWYIGLDCALATSWFGSYGVFSADLENHLLDVLQRIPAEASIILANHFPYLSTRNPRHDLHNHRRLNHVIQQDERIKLYLHGHIHTPKITIKKGHPTILNAGSCTNRYHHTFYVIDLERKTCDHYRLTPTNYIHIKTYILP